MVLESQRHLSMFGLLTFSFETIPPKLSTLANQLIPLTMKNFTFVILLSLLCLPTVYAKDIDLKGKAVLVTGASSGIGRSIAEALAKKGAFVYAGARKAKDITELSVMNNMMGLRLDVTKSKEIDAAVKLIKSEGRGLYGLVNNAGVFFHAPMIEVSESDLQFMMDVNVLGPYRVSKAFAPLIIESSGRISSTGSVAGIVSGSMFGPYSMSKFALEAFTDALSQEMQKFDVQVSIVEPGNFRSDIMKNMKKRLALIEKESQPSLYTKEYKAMVDFTATDRSQHKAPIAVANAVVHAMTSDKPKLRYLVTPVQAETNYTVTSALQRAVQLNQGHAHSLNKETLISTLDGLLE